MSPPKTRKKYIVKLKVTLQVPLWVQEMVWCVCQAVFTLLLDTKEAHITCLFSQKKLDKYESIVNYLVGSGQ